MSFYITFIYHTQNPLKNCELGKKMQINVSNYEGKKKQKQTYKWSIYYWSSKAHENVYKMNERMEILRELKFIKINYTL